MAIEGRDCILAWYLGSSEESNEKKFTKHFAFMLNRSTHQNAAVAAVVDFAAVECWEPGEAAAHSFAWAEQPASTASQSQLW